MGYHHLTLCELHRPEEIGRRSDRLTGDLGNRLLGNFDRQTFRSQPRAMADFADFELREIFLLRAAGCDGIADAIAGRTGPVRAIKGEDTRRDLRVAHSAAIPGQFFADSRVLPFSGQTTDRPPTQ